MSLSAAVGQLARFAGVGVAASLIYFVLAAAFSGLAGIGAAAASVLAYALAAVFAFIAHRRVTFSSKADPKRELWRFAAATIIGLALATLIPIALDEAAPLVSFFVVMLVVPICSFLMMKFFVFTRGGS